MPATRDGKTWRSQFYYEDWQGVRHKKNKRGFKTKAEAEEWERNFRQQQRKDLDINFKNFVEIYFSDVENRPRESTIKNKRYVFDLKVTPYFKKKKMCEIKTSNIRAWQNELIKQGYAPTYLKSINNQLAALFNYAVRYYDLKDNPCRKAGSIGKSKADDMEFWTKQEFKQFLPSMDKKPEARMAFMLLYRTGMRIGELLALTYENIDLEKRIISISKSYQRLDGKDVITPPKTPKSNRKITIPPFLAEELKEYCSHLYGIMPNERMFRFTKSYMEHEIVRGIKETGVKRIRIHDLRHPYVKHTTKIFSLRLMDFQAQAYPDAQRKTRGACQLHRGGQSQSPVRPLCNRKRFSCLPPQAKMSWILYAISMRLSGYTSTRSISSSASSVVSVSASKIALDASMRLSCRACSSCFCFACANTAA